MNPSVDQHSEGNVAGRTRRHSWVRTAIICLLIIALGTVGASYIKKTAPQAQKRPPERTVALVKTETLFPDSHQVVVTAMGSVIPAREVTLKARVPGQIRYKHPEFVEGGFIRSGETLLKIDAKDYELAMAQKQSAVVNAQYALKVEMGYQDVARREWSLLSPQPSANDQGNVQVNVDEDELALRRPHLAKANSDLSAARAELAQAQLNLDRTDIIAPFNAIVRSTHVDVGSQVSTQDALAQLVGTDAYWIQVSLPVERLAWIQIPRNNTEAGAAVTVIYRGNQRSGKVVRLLSDLATEGRMARILVAIEDPLEINSKIRGSGPPMLIGEYVRVQIQGQRLTDVFRIPRSALRDNSTIWLLGDDETLKIMPVETLWRDADYVLMKNGVTAGQRLIVSDLAVPVNGMPLKDSAAGSPEKALQLSNHIEKSDG